MCAEPVRCDIPFTCSGITETLVSRLSQFPAERTAPIRASLLPLIVTEDIEITVNGETRRIAAGTTVGGLLVALGFTTPRVAVERNREVVPRRDHQDVVLVAGDQIEIVTFVGGG